MPSRDKPLARLRSIRNKIRDLDAQREDLVEGRDILICEAAERGVSERMIADAADLHHSRIGQIKKKRLPSG